MRPLDPRLLKYASAAKTYLAVITLTGCVTASLVIAQAIVLGTLISAVFLDSKQLSDCTSPLVALAAITILRTALAWTNDVLATRASSVTKSQLRDVAMNKVAHLGPMWLTSQKSSDIANVVGRGLDGLDVYFARYLPQLVLATVIPVSVGVVILTQDFLSAVIVAITIPLIPFFMVLVGQFTQAQVDQKWSSLQRLAGHFHDLIIGLPTLKAFNRSKGQRDAIRQVGSEYQKSTMAVLRISFLSALVLELISTLSVALVAVSIGLRLVNGSFHLREGLIILILVPEAYIPIKHLGTQYHAVQDGLAAAAELFNILDTDSSGGVRRGHAEVTAVDTIEFQDVTYSYPGYDTPAIQGFSATFHAGTLGTIVGQSGSGKTTALNLLMGFATPDQGRILINGVNLVSLNPEQWRTKISFVSQHPWMPTGTLRTALLMGRPQATTDELLSACAQAGLAIDDVGEFADGLDTPIGPRTGVSVGQRRRIAFARSCLSDASIVLLDEPTASLDGPTEDALMDVILALRGQGKLVIAVTHRSTLIALADSATSMHPAVTS